MKEQPIHRPDYVILEPEEGARFQQTVSQEAFKTVEEVGTRKFSWSVRLMSLIVLLLMAFFLSGSVGVILELFPRAVLGVILFLTGAQLALGSCDFSKNKKERFITLVTAALSMWNVGLAFVAGVMLAYLKERDLLHL